jgi:hypothetical protein
MAFADDLLIYANDRARMEFILAKVTKALRNHNMMLAKDKSQLIRKMMCKDYFIAGIRQIPTMKYLGMGISGSVGRMKDCVTETLKKSIGGLWTVTKSSSTKTRTHIMRSYLDSVLRYQLGPLVVAGVVGQVFVDEMEAKMLKSSFNVPTYT